MISDALTLTGREGETVKALLGWRPNHGVLSIYLRLDPGHRSPSWPAEVRNGLSGALRDAAEAEDHEARQALRATAGRLERELHADEQAPAAASGLIGFVEVARAPAEERWYAAQVAPRRTAVLHAAAPAVHQLLELLDDGAPLGVAVISSERVRLLDWRLGRMEQLHDWELEYFGEDWRERKSQRPRDPAHGEAVSAAGRDQYNQRLEATRERFAHQSGELARAEAWRGDWRETLAFGDERYVSQFARGFGVAFDLRHVDGADLISEPIAQTERRVAEMLPGLNRDRERSLIERIKEVAYTEGRSSLGIQETLQALREGRVEHLVYDAGREYSDARFASKAGLTENGVPLIERMIGYAVSSGAAITPVDRESAALLDEQDGVASLLRY